MDILVEGKGEKSFKPNQIEISFEFRTVAETYDEVLSLGVKNVENYFEVLKTMKFEKESLKTRSFRVYENRVYDDKTRTYKNEGYAFNQSVKLKFEYNMQRLSSLMEITSKQKNPPTYQIIFNIKDDKKVEREIIALAVEDAKFQAEAIASASGKKLKDCIKISFQPFDEKIESPTRFGESRAMCKSASVSESIQNVFVPEDVEIEKTIYCLWTAE